MTSHLIDAFIWWSLLNHTQDLFQLRLSRIILHSPHYVFDDYSMCPTWSFLWGTAMTFLPCLSLLLTTLSAHMCRFHANFLHTLVWYPQHSAMSRSPCHHCLADERWVPVHTHSKHWGWAPWASLWPWGSRSWPPHCPSFLPANLHWSQFLCMIPFSLGSGRTSQVCLPHSWPVSKVPLLLLTVSKWINTALSF